MAALKEIHDAGNTIIMVTHNPDLAAYGDRVIKMVDGVIVEEFTGASLAAELKNQRKEAEIIVGAATSNAIEPKKKQGSASKKKIGKDSSKQIVLKRKTSKKVKKS